MSKHSTQIEEVAIDKVESYINRNFKQILGILIGIVVLGLAIYGLKQYYDSQKVAKINKIGEFEVKINAGDVTVDLMDRYVKTCESISDLKDYCYFRAGVVLVGIGENKGKEYLKKVNGEYKEFADSILADIGEKVDLGQYKEKGKLSTIWKYRAVFQDKKQLNVLDNATLNSRLIATIKNWE